MVYGPDIQEVHLLGYEKVRSGWEGKKKKKGLKTKRVPMAENSLVLRETKGGHKG